MYRKKLVFKFKLKEFGFEMLNISLEDTKLILKSVAFLEKVACSFKPEKLRNIS